MTLYELRSGTGEKPIPEQVMITKAAACQGATATLHARRAYIRYQH
jgi:hypothetical protein